MATVGELTDPYVNVLLAPLAPATPDVCSVCLTFTSGFTTCYRCGHDPRFADAVLPVSYSPHFGQLHTELAAYKRTSGQAAQRLKLQLAAVLWRFLTAHEGCLALAAGVASFDRVTTVPRGLPSATKHIRFERSSAPSSSRHEVVMSGSFCGVALRSRIERLFVRGSRRPAGWSRSPFFSSTTRGRPVLAPKALPGR